MLIKNLLALLLAGLAVVTATNSSSSSDTTGSSSSSDTTVTGSSSSSSDTPHTMMGNGSSSSSDTTVTVSDTTVTPMTVSDTTVTPMTVSDTTVTPMTGGSSSSSSTQGTQTTGNTTVTTTVTAAADTEQHQVKGNIALKIAIPDGASGSSLLEETSFVKAWECAIAEAAKLLLTVGGPCDAAKVTVTSFTVGSGRLRQLAATNQTSLVTAMYTIAFASEAAAITGKTDTEAAIRGTATIFKNSLARGDDSSGNAVPPVIGGTAITVDQNFAVTISSNTFKAVVKNSGDWTLMWYSDAACSAKAPVVSTYTDVTDGKLGSTCESYKDANTDKGLTIKSCSSGARMTGTHTPSSGCAGSASVLSMVEGRCYKTATGKYRKVSCGTSDPATSDAKSKSIVGVMVGLFMGLVSLV